MTKLTSLLVLALAGSLASAQPAPAPGGSTTPAPAPASQKLDAKQLMASGLKLYAAKDYLGALAVFTEAYEKFPSSKILLNIGTTEKALGRNADAANTYQRYLDAADADPAKRPLVEKELTELDPKLGIVEVKASLADAEMQIGDEPWHPAAELSKYRVEPGKITIRARKTRFQPWEKTVELTPGASTSLSVDLIAEPQAVATTTTAVVPVGTGVAARVTPEVPPSRWGAIALAHVDFKYKGAAGVVGATALITGGLSGEVAAILGPSSGAYLGARYRLMAGAFHPVIAAGLPVFVSSGARVGVRGAGGVEYELNRHVALVAEVGVEHVFNPQPNIASTLFVPAVGALARL